MWQDTHDAELEDEFRDILICLYSLEDVLSDSEFLLGLRDCCH